MKKLKSKPKKKIKRISKRKNPTIFDKEEIKKQMQHFVKNKDLISIVNKQLSNLSGDIDTYGILKSLAHYDDIWIFQFNPLNQWKYGKREQNTEKVQPIVRTSKEPEFIDYGNEFDHHLLIESEFENDEPTLEFLFESRNISSIFNNTIYLNISTQLVIREAMD